MTVLEAIREVVLFSSDGLTYGQIAKEVSRLLGTIVNVTEIKTEVKRNKRAFIEIEGKLTINLP